MDILTNADIAELLAVAAQSAKQPLQKALRRASRKAFLWPEEASEIAREERSLEELPGVGPSLNRIIRRWIQDPTDVPKPPEIRAGFLTALRAREILEAHPSWLKGVKGDLQMHTLLSDGNSAIEEVG